MLKEVMFRDIDGIRNEMTAMADDIFDHPEIGLEEFHAQKVLTDWLEKEGFAVERGVVGVETAFKAVYRHGEGGPNIGLLCEYDALPGIGHACGHHMQGPSILAAAKALKDAEIRKPYTITVYGTPAEESVSGKIRMIQNGCTFEELDENYRYTFIDAPPLNLVSDGEKIGSLCDGALLVVRAGETPKAMVRNSIRQLERAGCPVVGIALSRAKGAANGYYHKYGNYYGKSYYGKGYGYYGKHGYYGYGTEQK